MKKRFITSIMLVFCIIFCSCVACPMASADAPTESKVIETANDARSARFLNMLNHNFVYGDAFSGFDSMITASTAAVSDLAVGGVVKEEFLKGYLKDMFGLNISDMSGYNAVISAAPGYVAVPVNFARYNHSIVSITDNTDGTISVMTNVSVLSADGTTQNGTAVTLFVKDEFSSFGYNIVYSNLLFGGLSL